MSDSEITTWATVVVAATGLLGIIATALLALSASKTAEKAANAAQQQAAVLIPDLVPSASEARGTSEVVNGSVSCVSGAVPAREINVWVRGPRGYYHAVIALMRPGSNDERFSARLESADKAKGWDGATLAGELEDGENFIGISWKVGDYSISRVYRSVSGKVVGEREAS